MAIFAEENGWLNEDSEVPYMEVLRTKGNWIICKILGGDPGYVLTNKETGHRVSFDSITEAKDYVEAFEKTERFVTLGKLGDPVPPLKENAKAIVAEGKPKTESVPPIAVLALGAAMQNGSDKYGKFNWRDTEVKASTFYNAMMRHLITWYNGEDYADDSGIHHLAHLMASCAIILDAENNHVFVDDRSPGRMINLNVYAAQAGGNTWVLAEANEAISERDVLKQQLADSQKREVMLRDALDHANSILVKSYDHVIHSVVKALAAAADLDDLVLCHAEPAAIVYREYGGNGAILQTELADDEPLYRAWKQKWEVK